MPRIAVEGGALQLSTRNPRDYSGNKWRRVDDRHYGGGPGMVMEAEPQARAITAARAELGEVRVIGLSPQDQPLKQAKVETLAQMPALVFVCGRYEGIDERFVRTQLDMELSLGDFVLSDGAPAAPA